jgi:hypothetical protein
MREIRNQWAQQNSGGNKGIHFPFPHEPRGQISFGLHPAPMPHYLNLFCLDLPQGLVERGKGDVRISLGNIEGR